MPGDILIGIGGRHFETIEDFHRALDGVGERLVRIHSSAITHPRLRPTKNGRRTSGFTSHGGRMIRVQIVASSAVTKAGLESLLQNHPGLHVMKETFEELQPAPQKLKTPTPSSSPMSYLPNLKAGTTR